MSLLNSAVGMDGPQYMSMDDSSRAMLSLGDRGFTLIPRHESFMGCCRTEKEWTIAPYESIAPGSSPAVMLTAIEYASCCDLCCDLNSKYVIYGGEVTREQAVSQTLPPLLSVEREMGGLFCDPRKTHVINGAGDDIGTAQIPGCSQAPAVEVQAPTGVGHYSIHPELCCGGLCINANLDHTVAYPIHSIADDRPIGDAEIFRVKLSAVQKYLKGQTQYALRYPQDPAPPTANVRAVLLAAALRLDKEFDKKKR